MALPLPWSRLRDRAPLIAAAKFRWMIAASGAAAVLFVPLVFLPWPVLAAIVIVQALIAWGSLGAVRVLLYWRRAPCIIVSGEVKHTAQKRRESATRATVIDHWYEADLRYSYRVDTAAEGGRGAIESREYTGRDLSNINFRHDNAAYARQVLSFFRPGDPAFCWHDPRRPEKSVLLRSPLWFFSILLAPWSSIGLFPIARAGLRESLSKAQSRLPDGLCNRYRDLFAATPWTRLAAVHRLLDDKPEGAFELLEQILRDAEEYPRIHTAILEGFAQWTDPRAVAAAMDAIAIPSMRETAIETLAEQLDGGAKIPPDRDLLPALLDILDEAAPDFGAGRRHSEVRHIVVRMLARLADRRALPALVLLLVDEDDDLRRDALLALDAVDPSWRESREAAAAIPALIGALDESSAFAREHAAAALAEIGEPAFDRLLQYLDARTSKHAFAYNAVDALAGIGNPHAVPALLRAAKVNVNRTLIEALGKIGDSSAAPFLGGLLTGSETADGHGLDGNIVAALERIGGQQAALFLLDAITAGRAASNAAAALGRLDPAWRASPAARDALPRIVAKLAGYSTSERASIVNLLSTVDRAWRESAAAREQFTALAGRLADPDRNQRHDARRSLALLDPEWSSRDEVRRLTQPLLATLARKQASEAPNGVDRHAWIVEWQRTSEIRAGAAEALGYLAAIEAVPLLIECISDNVHRVQVAAIRALGHLDDSRAFAALSELATTPTADKVRHELRRTAIEALGTLGELQPKPVIEVLSRLIPEGYIEFPAVEALARMGTHDALSAIARGLSREFPVLANVNGDILQTLVMLFRKEHRFQNALLILERLAKAG